MTSDRPRALLRNKGIRPIKRLGQSFLEDRNVINKIVRIADLQSSDVVVEVGAGLGVMTDLLARKACRVIALEIDPYMISILHEQLKERSNVDIIQTDVLKYDFSSISADYPARKLKIIGNIPYNIASQILFHLLTFRNCIKSMILMFQKEMADRIMAPPGTKSYGIPSVIINMHAQISQEMIIPGSCFYPPPTVLSSLLRFVIRETPMFHLVDEDAFLQIVKVAFSRRRKTLFNNLRGSSLIGFSEHRANLLLEMADIDGQRRAETLSIEEFGKLSNALIKIK
jgi:16S rRNA (adenine1518-N6/adenine1519-N6)-dimethyltransferase